MGHDGVFLLHRGQAARQHARELCDAAEAARLMSRGLVAQRMARLDALAGDVPVTAEQEEAICRFATAVGRDPAIERAKTVLTRQWSITRDQAFQLMVRTSQNRNVKVREVAHGILEANCG